MNDAQMSMRALLDPMDAIVIAVVLFTVVFFAAWLASPKLRAWVERPKYRFLADLEGFDHAQRGDIRK